VGIVGLLYGLRKRRRICITLLAALVLLASTSMLKRGRDYNKMSKKKYFFRVSGESDKEMVAVYESFEMGHERHVDARWEALKHRYTGVVRALTEEQFNAILEGL
jgi:hypothetical protein